MTIKKKKQKSGKTWRRAKDFLERRFGKLPMRVVWVGKKEEPRK